MNKKVNTVLFIIAATIFNVVVMVIIMTLGLALLSMLVGENMNPGMAQFLFLMLFVLSIAGAFGVYHLAIGLLSKRIDMEKHFHPIFRRRR